MITEIIDDGVHACNPHRHKILNKANLHGMKGATVKMPSCLAEFSHFQRNVT